MAQLREATFRIRLLTPLWTGDTDQACAARVLETGIMGSLRWWLEACARGAGMSDVLDPTRDAPVYDPEDKDKLDRVSRVFGATGWRRRFRLTASGRDRVEIPWKIKLAKPLPVTSGRPFSEWFYGRGQVGDVTEALCGSIDLRIVQTGPWNNYDRTSLSLFRDLLTFIARAGALGAKPQLGLGVIAVDSAAGDFESDAGLIPWLGSQRPSGMGQLPSLDRFVFGQREVPAPAAGESRHNYWRDKTFKVKAGLRTQFRRGGLLGKNLRHELMGEAGESPVRCKVNISHPYPEGDGWRQRFWAWIPEYLEQSYRGMPDYRGGSLRNEVLTYFTGAHSFREEPCKSLLKGW